MKKVYAFVVRFAVRAALYLAGWRTQFVRHGQIPDEMPFTIGAEAEGWLCDLSGNPMSVPDFVAGLSGGEERFEILDVGTVKLEFGNDQIEVELLPTRLRSKLVARFMAADKFFRDQGVRVLWRNTRPKHWPPQTSAGKQRHVALAHALSLLYERAISPEEVTRLFCQGPGSSASSQFHGGGDPLTNRWAARAHRILNEWGAFLANLIGFFYGAPMCRGAFWNRKPFHPSVRSSWEMCRADFPGAIRDLLESRRAAIRVTEEGLVEPDGISPATTAGGLSTIYPDCRPTRLKTFEWRSPPATALGFAFFLEIFCDVALSAYCNRSRKEIPRRSRDEWERSLGKPDLGQSESE